MRLPALKLLALSAGILLGFLLGSAPLSGQRAPSANYENDKKVKLSGIVTRIDWVNPSAFFSVNVKDSTGTIAAWAVEIGNPLDLQKDGWKPTALRIGDMVTVEGIPARGPRRQAMATSVVVARTGAKVFVPSNKKAVKAASQPAPRWPDGHPRLGPPPGKKGYWGTPSSTVLVENTGVAIPMNRDGLLANITDSDKVAPFQPWAKAVYEYRQRTLFKDDPYNRCIPPGGARHFQNSYGFQFIEQPEVGRILLLLGGGDRNWRIIYTDGRPIGHKDELVQTYYGASTGHWEGDTLVVDTVGFNEKFWFTNGGLPHTEALHLTERFTRSDLNTLRYQVTVDDPQTYTRTWTGGWTIQWVPDEEIQEYFCEENAESTFIR
ncbi:MAG: hypothetical protein JWO19_5145 [Bryobacterales bacterium]|jgi:hypothetical protein|nr:hypothetical protein [Bryobacterales bacterium]